MVIKDCDEFYECRFFFLKYLFVSMFYVIVYLLYVDNNVNVVIGRVIELFFGNYGLNGIGIDVVFV